MLRKIERYEVEEEIGHGGMATVYRARDTKLDRLVALKIMHPHLRGAKEARARFRREAQSVARLAHPRILEIYDYSGEGSEESYIASKLLTGPTLRRWAEEHAPVPAEIAACIGIEICAALTAAHDKKIIHRDVKPENILLHENRELVLTDFGIADMVDSQSMTATGQILGSPGHMAPEQIEGGHADARTDVFALGTVLYYLATGRLPFTGKNPHQILKRIADGEYADPLRIAPRIGGRFAGILKKALARDRDERHASAEALAEDLRAFVSEVGIEDAHATLAKFLAAPDAETAALVPRVIAANMALGKAARDAGRIHDASDRFGRVLALDEGNAEVLALVQRMQKDARRPGGGAIAAGIAAVIAIAAGSWIAITHPFDEPVVATADAGTEGRPDAALGAGVSTEDGGPEDGATDAADVTTDAPDDGGRALDAGRDAPRREIPRVTGTRRVVFSPDPVNVSISIDDGPGRSPVELERMGGVELTLGGHRVRYTPNEHVVCCHAESFPFDVVAGNGPMRIAHRLRSDDAELCITARGPLGRVFGRVEVGNDVIVARGTTGGCFSVPIRSESRHETLSFRIIQPGFRTYVGSVELEAGVAHPVPIITMEPETTVPAPEPDPVPPEGAPTP